MIICKSSRPRVSIIIPIFNVKPFLRACLDSAVGQTLCDIEIICVNDGSTDGSRTILSDYDATDSRIIVIDKVNGGVSSARNAGLQIARGDYIRFLDGDDMLVPDACETLCRRASQDHADIVLGGVVFMLPNGDVTKREVFPNAVYDLANPREFREVLRRGLEWGVPFQFYSRQILIGSDFAPLSHGEDTLFFTQIVCRAARMTVVGRPLYVYVQHKDSAIHSTRAEAFVSIQDSRMRGWLLLQKCAHYEHVYDLAWRRWFGYAIQSFGSLQRMYGSCSQEDLQEAREFWLRTYRRVLCAEGTKPRWLGSVTKILFCSRTLCFFHVLYYSWYLWRCVCGICQKLGTVKDSPSEVVESVASGCKASERM